MGDCARCIYCSSDDVECTGAKQYEEDEYYCHECESYFTIDWDLQDEIEELEKDEDDIDEGEWENEGGRCEA